MPMHRLARCVRHHACAVLRCRRNRKQRTSCAGGAIWLFLTTFLLRDLRYSIDRTVRITNHAEGETTMAKPALPADNLFSALPPELSRHLFDEARVQNVKADQVVFLSGDAGDGCYRIEEGLLKVSVITPGGAERILAILGPGSIVGELSMIDGSARSASVSALRDSKLSFISRAGFDAFGRSNPDMYQYLMVVLARRLRDTNSARWRRRASCRSRGASRAFAAQPGGGVRPRRRRWPHPGAAEGDAIGPRRNGRHRARKCQPDPEGVDHPGGGEPPCRILLPGEKGGDRTRGGALKSGRRRPATLESGDRPALLPPKASSNGFFMTGAARRRPSAARCCACARPPVAADRSRIAGSGNRAP